MQAVYLGLKTLEDKLTSDILLPNQVELLRQSEFASLLQRYNGDFDKTISQFYDVEFNLTTEQKKLVRDLQVEKRAKIRKLALEYQRQVQDVQNESKRRLASVLTPKQRTIIEKLSGEKLITSKDETQAP